MFSPLVLFRQDPVTRVEKANVGLFWYVVWHVVPKGEFLSQTPAWGVFDWGQGIGDSVFYIMGTNMFNQPSPRPKLQTR